MDQEEAVTQLVKAVKGQGLSVILLTGYLYDDLRKSRDIYVQRTPRNIDLMADGPFTENKLDSSRPWMGSENQKYISLSGKCSKKDLVDIRAKSQHKVRVYPDDDARISGMRDLKKVGRFLKVDSGMV